jgi:hypothetical protein
LTGISTYLGRGIHKVKLEEILHSERFQQEDRVGQIGSLDFRDIAREQLVQIGSLCEKTITESTLNRSATFITSNPFGM